MIKMNYLLVMPRFVDKVGEWYQMPVGMLYISATMKKEGFKVYTLNLNNEYGLVEDILRAFILENNIDVVLTGGISPHFNIIKKILILSKRCKPEIRTIVGGGLITSAPEPAMKALEFADYGVIGEGEWTSCELCRALERNTDVSNIAGLIFNRDGGGGGYVRTVLRPEIVELDNLPFPDYEGFGFDKLLAAAPNQLGMNENNVIPFLASRSCPFQCTFCFHSSGAKYRQRSLDSVFAEIDYLTHKYPVNYIFMLDELFSYNTERVKEFCRRIKPFGIKWMAQFRVADVTSEMVDIIKNSNCDLISFGIESADNRILKSMKKGITIKQTEQALELVHAAGIAIQGNFIFGDAEETIETAKNTLEWWKAHRQYNLMLNFITTYPGTELYKYALAQNIIKDEEQFIKDGCPTLNVSKMSQNEMNWLTEQIAVLPLQMLPEPQNISRFQINHRQCAVNIAGDCAICGKSQNWNTRLFTRNFLQCAACGAKHKIPLTNEIKLSLSDSVRNLLETAPTIAFWGMIDYFVEMVSELEVLKDTRLFFIDKAVPKQGTTLMDRTIYAPAILNQKNIPLVVVMVLASFEAIQEEIAVNYPSVKRVISIADLL